MAANFFNGWDEMVDGLGKKITQKAKELSGQAETVYEIQKLRNKISNANRAMNKAKADLGNIIYKQYVKGMEISDNQKILCEKIDTYMQQIHACEEAIAEIKGMKVCPSCEQKINADASFCPNCGTACTVVDDIVIDEEIFDDEEEHDFPKFEDEKIEEVSMENKEKN